MRFKWLNDYWSGVGLLLVVALLSLWLAVHGRLGLYIHPRYIIFTVVMCTTGAALAIAGMAVKSHRPRVVRPTWIGGIALSIICLLLCALLLIVKPAGLTSSAASQRGVDTSGLTTTLSTTSVNDLIAPDAAYQRFNLKEWSSLLAQSGDISLFKDKQAHVTGFISPSDKNPTMFYLSRFVVTCCAVDARPISVPIYYPNWQATYRADQWLDVTGMFITNPGGSQPAILLKPSAAKPIAEPAEPYVY
jgi:uncharacterized repeat protein (TIGR03943 family)